MNGFLDSPRTSRVASLKVIVAILTIGSVIWSSGCAEHRIGLHEFLQEQQATQTLQPKPDEVTEPIDLGSFIGPYRVGPGDVLTVAMTGDDGAPLFPPTTCRLDRAGQADLPLVGKLAVNDLELVDVEDVILSAYVPSVFKSATCHAALASVETTDVVVVGAVALPGMVPLRRTERNMLFAIVGAGGVSDLSSGHATLRRIRQPAAEVTLNLRDPVQLRASLTLAPLERGDIVTVHAAQPNTIYVGGLVNVGGPQFYPSGTQVTLLQALAAARGLRTDVFPKEGTLIRRMPDGTDAFVKLDLDRLTTGKDPNIVLASGDILWVPDTVATRIQDWFNQNMFLRGGVTATYNYSGFKSMGTDGSFSGGQTLQDSFDPLGFLMPQPNIAAFKSVPR